MKSNLTNLAYGQEEPYTFLLNESKSGLNEQRDQEQSSKGWASIEHKGGRIGKIFGSLSL